MLQLETKFISGNLKDINLGGGTVSMNLKKNMNKKHARTSIYNKKKQTNKNV